MRFSISETAEYGDVTVGPKIIDDHVKKEMRAQLKRIQSGEFAKEWVNEFNNGQPNFNRLRKESEAHPIEEVGKRLRGLMSWVKKREIGGSQASYE
jgi:ketol-acid reductoisomerase